MMWIESYLEKLPNALLVYLKKTPNSAIWTGSSASTIWPDWLCRRQEEQLIAKYYYELYPTMRQPISF